MKENRNINYRALFALGVVFMGASVAIDQVGLMGVGVLFFIIGAANRAKWGQDKQEE